MSRVGSIAACDPKSLYLSEGIPLTNGQTLWQVLFSKDGGQTWTAKSVSMGKEIACDHAQLASLDATGKLWVAQLSANGNISGWNDAATSILVDRISGGDGSFYGVKFGSPGNSIYVASAKAASAPLYWNSPIATGVGARQVTGTGLTNTGSDNQVVGNPLSWSRRAFGLEPDGSLVSNLTLLANQNLWSWVNTGNERYEAIAAAAPNLVYGLQMKSGTRRIARIRIEEYDCTDGVDNDANGLKDGEDDACTMVVANTFCAGRANGTYCADRYLPSFFKDQTNQNASLTRCTGGVAVSVTPGVCNRNPNFSNADSLATEESLVIPDPPNTARYCNVHYGDGTWDLRWTGSDPCAAIINAKPGGKIVRAGLYSTTGTNYGFVRCNNGGSGLTGNTGATPISYLYNLVGHTANRCIFQISPAALPIFDRMFYASHELPLPRKTNPFIHNHQPVELDQFGLGQSGPSDGVDRFGKHFGQWESAYDHPINEGRPMLAVANGIVIPNGSRDRDVSRFGCPGTPYQGEVMVRYTVGTHPTYREQFVLSYAHLRKRLVVPGQTVKAGQIVGYVGSTGCTGGFGHLHEGVMRTTNTNAHTTANPEIGYRMNLLATTAEDSGTNFGPDIAMDQLGWANGSAFDPWASTEWTSSSSAGFTGKGVWSIRLVKPGTEFHYP